jgi:hypothetical protein
MYLRHHKYRLKACFFNCSDVAVLKDIESRDPLSEISEQEKELLWTFR